MNSEHAVEITGLTKRYPGVTALDGVSLQIGGGRVEAVMGENGAGKSTLMQILAGVQPPDAGAIRVFGAPIRRYSPHTAMTVHGLALVPQELVLCPDMTVAQNILLGAEPRRGPFPSVVTMERESRTLLNELQSTVDPSLPVQRLGIADRQFVVIARALARRCRVLILDEPTTLLTPAEVEKLFALLRRLRAAGTTIVYVSHRIDEVFALADRIHVLRDGRLVASRPAREFTPAEVVRAMVGRDLPERSGAVDQPAGRDDVLCRITGFSGRGFNDVSLELYRGEILGVAGLPDAGRSELLTGLFGASPVLGGQLELGDRTLRLRSPAEAIRAGIGYVPAERRAHGILPTMSVAENLVALQLPVLSRLGFVWWPAVRRQAQLQAKRLQVKFRDANQAIRELSGGNQQKVILARWMALGTRLLLLDEPTRGIDVAAKLEIFHLLRQMTRQGTGVIVSSSDLPELLRECDRIAVMRRGCIVGVVAGTGTTEEHIMRLATGVKERIA